jgi:hypothetical protein
MALTEGQAIGLMFDVAARALERGASEEEAVAEAAQTLERSEARLAWLEAQFDEMRRLHDALTDYWGAWADAHHEWDPEDEDSAVAPDPPEQAELEVIEEAIRLVREEDRWPKHLYFADD